MGGLDSLTKDLEANVGETVDRLITADVANRLAVHTLYGLARSKYVHPLAMGAAKLLAASLRSGDIAFIATGWPNRPRISPSIAESDGPAGAVVLGRALQRAFNVVPAFVVEPTLVKPMLLVAQAGGFKVISSKEALSAIRAGVPVEPAALVMDFPVDVERAKTVAADMVNMYRPAVLVVIEKGGFNREGAILTAWANDTTAYMAKIDFLVKEIRRNGRPVIGIGDGGNEIGMSTIAEGISRSLPFGDRIVPVSQTDFLVVSAVSNWGAYGIAACLAFLNQDARVFHNEEIERRILHACADAGLIDGLTGRVEEGVDGMEWSVHVSLVRILRKTVETAIERAKGVEL